MKKLLIVLCIFILSLQILFASDGINYFPGEEWRKSSMEAQGIDPVFINGMFDEIGSANLDIHSIIIIKNGYVVLEAYSALNTENDKHILYSCTKSFTSAMIGAAIDDGLLQGVNEKISKYISIPESAKDLKKEEITIKNLLTMQSGLKWNEYASYGSFENSLNDSLMSKNMVDYIISKPMTENPGEKFNYSSGNTQLLSAVITKTTGKSLFTYAKDRIFSPIGIKDAVWTMDSQGNSHGGLGLYLKPLDMARFGYLFLRKGKWNDKQLLSENWIKESSDSHVVFNDKEIFNGSFKGYGYQWWTDRNGGYSAEGSGGQVIWVMPEMDTVVVMTSAVKNNIAPFKLIEKYVYPALSKNIVAENKEITDKISHKIRARVTPQKVIREIPKAFAAINGKEITFVDGSKVKLEFNDNGEGTYSYSSNYAKYNLPIGIDGIRRFTEMQSYGPVYKNPKNGIIGNWINDNTFEVRCQAIGDADETIFTFTVKDSEIEFALSSSLIGMVFYKTTGKIN